VLADYALGRGELTVDLQQGGRCEQFRETGESEAPLGAGVRDETEVGINWTPDQRQRLRLSAGFVRKTAKRAHLAFERGEIALEHRWFPIGQVFVSNRIDIGRESALDFDPNVNFNARKEFDVRYRLTIGVPITEIWPGDDPPAFFDDLAIVGAGEYFRSFSNIQNFKVQNVSGELMLQKTIRF